MNTSLLLYPALLWRRLWLIGLLCWPALASAQDTDLLVGIAVLRDDSSALPFEAVRQADFTPHQGVFSAGYTDATHWLRIEVRPQADGSPVRLRIRPTFIDELTLYEPDTTQPHQWQQREGGDKQQAGKSQRGINSLGFLVYPQAPFSTYYVRLQSSSTSLLEVQALPLSEANRLDAVLALWNFIYLALLVSMLGWAIQDYVQFRQKVIGLFVLYQSFNLLYAFAIMGYFTVFEDPQHNGFSDLATSLCVLLITPIALLFHKVFLQPYRPHPLLLRLINILLLASALQPLLYFVGWQQQALSNNALLGLIASLAGVTMALSIRDQGNPSKRHIRATYAFLGCAQMLFLMPFLGLIDAYNWSLQWPLIQGLLVSLLIFLMLYQRSRNLRQALEKRAQKHALDVLQLEREKAHAESLRQFVDMLSHEIKTPLAVAVMNLDAIHDDGPYLQRAQRALGNINSIMERTRLTEAAEQQRLTPKIQWLNISELVYECIETCSAPERVQACVGSGLEANSDADFLGVIITNLLDNALKYSPIDNAITLSLTRSPSGIKLSICNAVGPAGLPDPQHVFNKFYRSPNAYAKSGSGLGLYLSRTLSEMIGARLQYCPHPQAVEFVLWIAV